jgi:hypothetical protein
MLQDVMITSIQKTAMGDGSVRPQEVIKMSFVRDATHESSSGGGISGKETNLKTYKYRANAMLNGDGAPAPITLQKVQLLGNTHAIIVVCDVGGGHATAGLQRAMMAKQKLPSLTLATTGGGSQSPNQKIEKDVPYMRFTFSNVVITDGTSQGGGCTQFSLNFTRFDGPLAGFDWMK